MKILSRLPTFLIFCAIASPAVTPVHAQEGSEIQFHPDSRVWIDGTSNRDDWTVTASEMEGVVILNASEDEVQVQQARVTIPARSIEGGRSTIMDRLIHGALKANEHPEITYELTSADVVGSNGNTLQLNTNGNLTIGGTTREVQIPVSAERQVNGTVRFTGQHPLKMTDYGLTPPTAMFGALRTGDEVVVNFDVQVATQ